MELVRTITVPSKGIGFPDGSNAPSLIVFEGLTTANGNIGATTLVDDRLLLMPNLSGLIVWIVSGVNMGQARAIISHVGNVLTVNSALNAQVVTGVNYLVLPFYNFGGNILIPVPAPDSVLNVNECDVVGNKADASVGAVGATASMMAYIKGILNAITAGGPGPAVPVPDTINNLNERDVVGNKTDAAVGTVGLTASLMAYIKAILNAVVGGALGTVTDVASTVVNNATTAMSYIKGIVTNTNKPAADSVADGVMADVVGDKSDAAQSTIGTTRSLMGYVKGLLSVLGTLADAASIVVNNATTVMAYVKGILNQLADATIGLAAIKAVAISQGTTDFNATAKTSLQAAAAAALAAAVNKRQAGQPQVFQKSITSASNAGDVTVATITTAACCIESVVVKSVAAPPADLTSVSVWAASKVISLISVALGSFTNLNAIDAQVSQTGMCVELAATKTVVITMAGSGATANNLLVTVVYRAAADGGYLA